MYYFYKMNESQEICKSCGHEIEGNYCGNCGQRRFHRINRTYILDEFKSIFIASNKGFLYTVKRLLLNPGKTAREYINGDRQKHYKPILLALLLATISAFISFQLMDFNKYMSLMNEEMYGKDFKGVDFMDGYMGFMQSYYSLIMVGLLPLFAIASYVSFKKWGDNYYEHIVANAFFQAFYSIVIMLSYPLLILFSENGKSITIILLLSTFIVIPIYFWCMKGFYPKKDITSVIEKVLLNIIIMSVLLAILFVIIVVIVVLYMVATKKG